MARVAKPVGKGNEARGDPRLDCFHTMQPDFEMLPDFEELAAHDPRYSAKAYRILMLAIGEAGDGESDHVSSFDIMMSFKNLVLNVFGPMAFTVVRQLGVHSTDDLGEMMRNLVEHKYVRKGKGDNYDDFNDGFDFETEFLGPFLPRED